MKEIIVGPDNTLTIGKKRVKLEPIDINDKKKKTGEGQMRHKDGSYLNTEEIFEEKYNKKNGID
jgi:hypothetical protein